MSTNLYIEESKIINDAFLKCMDNKYSLNSKTTNDGVCLHDIGWLVGVGGRPGKYAMSQKQDSFAPMTSVLII